MPNAFTTWTPLPHGPLEKLAENLWRVEGTLPKMPLKRVMTVVRLADGRLLIHNAIALQAAEMAELEAWGEPAFLIVPNGWHRLDARVFLDRYPNMKVHCPAGATKNVTKVVPVTGSYSDFEDLDEARLFHLAGAKQNEGALQVRSADGTTLVFNDVIFNQPHLPGFKGLIMRMMGSTGGCKVTPVGRFLIGKDRAALRAQLEQLATIEDLQRVIVSHGELIDENAGPMLRGAADYL
jgi:hypothetical protein